MGRFRSKKSLAVLLAVLLGVVVAVVTGASAAVADGSAPTTPVPLPRLATERTVAPHVIAERRCWANVAGQVNLAQPIAVDPVDPVAVSASEVDPQGNEFLGDAIITVENVVVTENQVLTRVNVQWGSGLNVCLHYLAGP